MIEPFDNRDAPLRSQTKTGMLCYAGTDFLARCCLCVCQSISTTPTSQHHNLFSLGKKSKFWQSITIMTRYDHHPRFLDEQKDQASVLPCDESLCVSTTNFYSYFSCYAGNITEIALGNNAMCANGYIPRQIDEEPFHYFTCCPPISSSNKYEDDIKRHCSDVITLSKNTEEDTNGTAKCVNASQPYLRPMKNRTYLSHESFICCDSENDDTIDFLNITECVPFRDENYNEANVPSNEYGAIWSLSCNNFDTGFIYPNYIEDSSIRIRYECCKSSHDEATGPFITTGPYITDSAFKGTIYPQIVFSTIACICCTVLVIALLVPLVKHLQPPTRATPQHTSSATTTRTITSAPSTTTSRRSDYSSYNLYLIYLGVPDLVLNMYLVVMYSSYVLGYHNPWWSSYNILQSNIGVEFELSLLISCSTANLYLNTIVSYEIYLLLRNNHQVVRHKPPSFRRVSISAGSVCLLSIIVFCTNYFVHRAEVEANLRGNLAKRDNIRVALFTFSTLVSYIFPISCFFLIWGTIIYRKYTPSITGRLKELVHALR